MILYLIRILEIIWLCSYSDNPGIIAEPCHDILLLPVEEQFFLNRCSKSLLPWANKYLQKCFCAESVQNCKELS